MLSPSLPSIVIRSRIRAVRLVIAIAAFGTLMLATPALGNRRTAVAASGVPTSAPPMRALLNERSHVRIHGSHASCRTAAPGRQRSMCSLLQPFSQSTAAGLAIAVAPSDQNYWFFRRQGISISINPETHWWCLWLCSTTTNVEHISASITLGGGAGYVGESGQCSNCGSLSVWGPTYWGIGWNVSVPQAYQVVYWYGLVQANHAYYPFQGHGTF
jgi:hypothetical protein